jgi:hypothetical protein
MAAIYMWPIDDGVVVTTTLYPVEAQDSLAYSMDIQAGAMELIPSLNVTGGADLGNGSYEQLRWYFDHTFPPDNVTGAADLGDGTYIQLRWYYEDTFDPDNVTGAADLGPGGGYLRLKIEADSEDELLQLAADVSNSCSMDLV